jgi:hypothetical protein
VTTIHDHIDSERPLILPDVTRGVAFRWVGGATVQVRECHFTADGGYRIGSEVDMFMLERKPKTAGEAVVKIRAWARTEMPR